MTVRILQSEADALGFDLPRAIAAHVSALTKHASTINKPAPTAHPLVEQIVKAGGAFVLVDDSAEQSAAKRADMVARIQSDALRRMDQILSPSRRNLAQFDLATIGIKPLLPDGTEPAPGITYRTAEEETRRRDLAAQFERMAAVQRHSLLLQVEIEDIPDAQLDGWQAAGWPEV